MLAPRRRVAATASRRCWRWPAARPLLLIRRSQASVQRLQGDLRAAPHARTPEPPGRAPFAARPHPAARRLHRARGHRRVQRRGRSGLSRPADHLRAVSRRQPNQRRCPGRAALDPAYAPSHPGRPALRPAPPARGCCWPAHRAVSASPRRCALGRVAQSMAAEPDPLTSAARSARAARPLRRPKPADLRARTHFAAESVLSRWPAPGTLRPGGPRRATSSTRRPPTATPSPPRRSPLDLRAVAPGGIVSVPVSIREFPAYAIRMLATVRRAVLNSRWASTDPASARRSSIARPGTVRILASPAPFSPATVAAARRPGAGDRSFDLSYYPRHRRRRVPAPASTTTCPPSHLAPLA